MSYHYVQPTDYVVYAPELDLIFETIATFTLIEGVYYKMYNAELGEAVVVVALGVL